MAVTTQDYEILFNKHFNKRIARTVVKCNNSFASVVLKHLFDSQKNIK